MTAINRETSLKEMAALVSQALESAGISATLSGGGAVTLYSENEYESCDLDFITSARNEVIARAIGGLGFTLVSSTRQFEHPFSDYYVEFPPGPLGFGETVMADEDATTLQTEFGPVRIITPTQSVMDRLSAYVNWRDLQSWDQAVMVARRHVLDWDALHAWAEREGVGGDVLDRLQARARS